MSITEEELGRWEMELTKDLAVCLAPLAELEEPTDPTERDKEEAIVSLQKQFKDTSTAMARVGKEGIKNTVQITMISVIGITAQHEKQVEKASQKFEDLYDKLEDILDQIENQVEEDSRAGKQNAERRKGLGIMVNKYRTKMDSMTVFIAKAIADNTRVRNREINTPLPQVQVHPQKKAWKMRESSLSQNNWLVHALCMNSTGLSRIGIIGL